MDKDCKKVPDTQNALVKPSGIITVKHRLPAVVINLYLTQNIQGSASASWKKSTSLRKKSTGAEHVSPKKTEFIETTKDGVWEAGRRKTKTRRDIMKSRN